MGRRVGEANNCMKSSNPTFPNSTFYTTAIGFRHEGHAALSPNAAFKSSRQPEHIQCEGKQLSTLRALTPVFSMQMGQAQSSHVWIRRPWTQRPLPPHSRQW